MNRLVIDHGYTLFFLGALVFILYLRWLSRGSRSGKWETPKDFRERTGKPFPEKGRVFCCWKTGGPMYTKLKGLFDQGIAPNPDVWVSHAYASALALGDAHGEQMEILCANNFSSPPPRQDNNWRINNGCS